MMPWGHAAVGYLCFTILSRLRYRRSPTGAEVVALGLGTQFPDIIDKPLAAIGVLSYGRSLAHSLLSMALLFTVLFVLLRGSDNSRLLFPFAVGNVSHAFADIGGSLLQGQHFGTTFLVWPFYFETPAYTVPAYFQNEYVLFVFTNQNAQWGLALVVALLWLLESGPRIGRELRLKRVAKR
ncbi:LexA-binding, inner membrane-associated putative hydrolase [Halogranum rubrum]|uniref:LexA-binding, inner membrane-associated putative hydrolase n=1 Tax=Halogranum rubrum TaxID=553466 RepID=A0A1I4B7P9_9EURY|nr:metal-dependent hydrolase [Halogranum rubrum]SFK64952.1 LexA-binding, inner membrane-associated putative hydrolase [Halogranum rubrum]